MEGEHKIVCVEDLSLHNCYTLPLSGLLTMLTLCANFNSTSPSFSNA
jgi:hypothetical protein